MNTLHLKIITPRKVVLEKDVFSVSVPTNQGEISVLPKHLNLFSLLEEGIVKIRTDKDEDYLAIGGGYLETDGEEVNILVSRAYRQSEIDEKLIEDAFSEAKKLLSQARDEHQKQTALALMRRSTIDRKLLKKRRRTV